MSVGEAMTEAVTLPESKVVVVDEPPVSLQAVGLDPPMLPQGERKAWLGVPPTSILAFVALAVALVATGLPDCRMVNVCEPRMGLVVTGS